jgi:hypothetical protein
MVYLRGGLENSFMACFRKEGQEKIRETFLYLLFSQKAREQS